ncbi:AMP-binding protein [Saccharopolyspora pogona]|uniref:AMP-binding protein n=1 Tax=Saccharopolyspora pogona TaxID=333966 RepID=UPI0016827B4C|nr:AMP-binding protein [Saccharopolyspora pogona]
MTTELAPRYLAVLTGATIPELLAAAAAERGEAPYADFAGEPVTLSALAEAVADAQRGLAALGVHRGDRVAVMLPNHLEHVVLVHALVGMRAVWVPVNTRLRGEPLAHVLTDCDPSLLIIDPRYAAELAALPRGTTQAWVVEYGTGIAPWRQGDAVRSVLPRPDGDDVVSIMYTSGTTGPAKGVQVTDRMLRAAALGTEAASTPRDGDVFFLWEPLCHIGGAQVLLLPLLRRVRLAFVERFSASAFWSQVVAAGATHIHHLGGILPMLLSRPRTESERRNVVRVSWGGGMTSEAWREAETRFGLRVRECYGMTEASSISTANVAGLGGGIGRALPWFDVEVHDEHGRPVPDGEIGEIVLRPLVDGLVTPGYFRNDEATARSRRGPWWRTGDRGRFTGGALHFIGRLTDSLRHRGENVSAWEVETIVNTHPAVAESAVVGVPAPEGDEDIKVFVAVTDPATFDPAEFVAWCGQRLARFQVPRYVAVVDDFPKTPSLRIQKSLLSRETSDAFDARRRMPSP